MDTFLALASTIVPDSIITTTNVLFSLYRSQKEGKKQQLLQDSGLRTKVTDIAGFLSNVIALNVLKNELDNAQETALVNYFAVVMSTMLTSSKTLKVIKYLSEANYTEKDNNTNQLINKNQYILRFCDLFFNVAKSPLIVRELKNHLDKINIADDKILNVINTSNVESKLLLAVNNDKSISKAIVPARKKTIMLSAKKYSNNISSRIFAGLKLKFY